MEEQKLRRMAWVMCSKTKGDNDSAGNNSTNDDCNDDFQYEIFGTCDRKYENITYDIDNNRDYSSCSDSYNDDVGNNCKESNDI